jgi:hypothetical protein
MLPHRLVRSAVVLAALSLSIPAMAEPVKAGCPEGETMAGSRCVKACPTAEAFVEPNGCECPAGYGKLLLGDGRGQCDHLRCPTGATFEAKRACDCPAGFDRTAPRGGKVKCEPHKVSKK